MPSRRYKALTEGEWDLHVAKNAGYAGAENPDPWANFRMCEAFGITAFQGCMVRLSDKYIRVTNLMKDPSNDRVGESLRDTLKDLSAYAKIAICLLDEQTLGTEVEEDARAAAQEAKEAEEHLWRDGVKDGLQAMQTKVERIMARLNLPVGHPMKITPTEAMQLLGIDPAPFLQAEPDTSVPCLPGSCCASPGAYPHAGTCHWCSKHSGILEGGDVVPVRCSEPRGWDSTVERCPETIQIDAEDNGPMTQCDRAKGHRGEHQYAEV